VKSRYLMRWLRRCHLASHAAVEAGRHAINKSGIVTRESARSEFDLHAAVGQRLESRADRDAALSAGNDAGAVILRRDRQALIGHRAERCRPGAVEALRRCLLRCDYSDRLVDNTTAQRKGGGKNSRKYRRKFIVCLRASALQYSAFERAPGRPSRLVNDRLPENPTAIPTGRCWRSAIVESRGSLTCDGPIPQFVLQSPELRRPRSGIPDGAFKFRVPSRS
jgi:hypothetical protein